jgi:hypothetical protein
MDPIFQQLNSWKTQQVDKKKNLVQFEKNLKEESEFKAKQEQEESEFKAKQEQEESERKEFERREQKKRDKLEEWTQRQFGMTLDQYEKWDTYLRNRTPEEFDRDCYRDPNMYYVDRIKQNAGIWF